MHRLRLVAVCALLLAAIGSAYGDQAETDAKARYQSGIAHYNLAELPEALADFKEAYRLHPDAVFLYNIAQCHRRMDKPADAATFYRAFLREAPAAPNRAEVDRLIAEMDTAAAEQKTRADERARADADAERARVAATTTTPAPVDATLTTPSPAPPKPLVKKAWFWGAVAGGVVVVAAAVTLGIVLGVQRDPKPSLGTVGVH